MKRYEVVEVVRMITLRHRKYLVDGVSEHDAIRQVQDGEAADGYRGATYTAENTEFAYWQVDGERVEFDPQRAVMIDDEFADIGGGD